MSEETPLPLVTVPPTLVARCSNYPEPDAGRTRCPGRLRFRWGQSEAPCDTCGARCGVAVADWVEVTR